MKTKTPLKKQEKRARRRKKQKLRAVEMKVREPVPRRAFSTRAKAVKTREDSDPLLEVKAQQYSNAFAYVNSVVDPWTGPNVRIPDRANFASGLVSQRYSNIHTGVFDLAYPTIWYFGIQVKPSNKQLFRTISSVNAGVITWSAWTDCQSQSIFETQLKQLRTVNTGVKIDNISNIQLRNGVAHINNSMIGSQYEDDLNELLTDSRTVVSNTTTNPDTKIFWKPATYQYGTVSGEAVNNNNGAVIYRDSEYAVFEDSVITYIWQGDSNQSFEIVIDQLFEVVPLAPFAVMYDLQVAIPADAQMDEIWAYLYEANGISVGAFRNMGIEQNTTTWWGSMLSSGGKKLLKALAKVGVRTAVGYFLGPAAGTLASVFVGNLTMKFHYLCFIRNMPSESPLRNDSYYRRQKVECKSIEDFDKFLSVRATMLKGADDEKSSEKADFDKAQRIELEEAGLNIK
jgi:hypothetical protein